MFRSLLSEAELDLLFMQVTSHWFSLVSL